MTRHREIRERVAEARDAAAPQGSTARLT